MAKLPAFALFPLASWREQLLPDEWVDCLDSWLTLIDSHLSLPQNDFNSISTKDESLSTFLTSFTRETALGGAGILGPSQSAKRLLKDVFLLTSRLLGSALPPSGLAEWEFLADFSRVYGKKKAEQLMSHISGQAQTQLDASLTGLKKFLIKNLDLGIQGGDLRAIEEQLDRVGDLIHVSPSVAGFFLAGDDFLDGIISCYKVMNPPLRKVIISTTYLCLLGLVEGQKASALTDVLYSLKTAGATHKAGPLNVNDSLVAELVTSTPVLQQLQRKLEDSGNTSTRTKSILAELATFRKLGAGMPKPKRLIKRKIDKGKGLAEHDEAQVQQEIHIHRMSHISQIQDLFPELGSGFISKLLDEYTDDTEQIVSHLLEDSLPPHLQSADRAEQLSPTTPHRDLAPRPTPPLGPTTALPTRHNIFDDDELDRLAVDTSRLQLGKRNLDADALLADRAAAPNKAAILSALAAFDSDDDERDDTYDAADVGGTVDAAGGEDDQPLAEGIEAALFRTWSAAPKLFDRDSGMRKSLERAKLRDETGMTDEQIEGWAVMLARDERLRKRLQVRYGEWTGAQTAIESTAWRAGIADEDGDEDSDGVGSGPGAGGPSRGGARGGGRGHGRGGRGGGRGGASTPPDTEQARRRKEANKGSRANHNRRDQRARKMARGGLPG
ncbi:hypothetical protein QBC34DRAFT_418464 [Podospora aff. communis PSN243]|uniref:CUE domain-containing protein n=1 Tax=Podospora aff. communis PSN243 TaxID=3040156 RepID=A0AAV9G5A3_9PEZI|nr:hypothetical protein QBC34DRAFT_418464 [Podospora aff. communis PSN243]